MKRHRNVDFTMDKEDVAEYGCPHCGSYKVLVVVPMTAITIYELKDGKWVVIQKDEGNEDWDRASYNCTDCGEVS